MAQPIRYTNLTDGVDQATLVGLVNAADADPNAVAGPFGAVKPPAIRDSEAGPYVDEEAGTKLVTIRSYKFGVNASPSSKFALLSTARGETQNWVEEFGVGTPTP